MAKESYLVQWYDDDDKEAGSIVLRVASLASAQKWAEKLRFRYPKILIADYYRYMENQDEFDQRNPDQSIIRASMMGGAKKTECKRVDEFKNKYRSVLEKV